VSHRLHRQESGRRPCSIGALGCYEDCSKVSRGRTTEHSLIARTKPGPLNGCRGVSLRRRFQPIRSRFKVDLIVEIDGRSSLAARCFDTILVLANRGNFCRISSSVSYLSLLSIVRREPLDPPDQTSELSSRMSSIIASHSCLPWLAFALSSIPSHPLIHPRPGHAPESP